MNNNEKILEVHSNGRQIHTGPRGGKYYYTKSNKKKYLKKTNIIKKYE